MQFDTFLHRRHNLAEKSVMTKGVLESLWKRLQRTELKMCWVSEGVEDKTDGLGVACRDEERKRALWGESLCITSPMLLKQIRTSWVPAKIKKPSLLSLHSIVQSLLSFLIFYEPALLGLTQHFTRWSVLRSLSPGSVFVFLFKRAARSSLNYSHVSSAGSRCPPLTVGLLNSFTLRAVRDWSTSVCEGSFTRLLQETHATD